MTQDPVPAHMEDFMICSPYYGPEIAHSTFENGKNHTHHLKPK
jgi:hypothetical protein